MAQTKAEKEAQDEASFYGNKTKGQEREETLAKEKFDPNLRGSRKSAEEVKSGGGLGAVAAAAKAKRDAEAAKSKPSPNAQAAKKSADSAEKKKRY